MIPDTYRSKMLTVTHKVRRSKWDEAVVVLELFGKQHQFNIVINLKYISQSLESSLKELYKNSQMMIDKGKKENDISIIKKTKSRESKNYTNISVIYRKRNTDCKDR